MASVNYFNEDTQQYEKIPFVGIGGGSGKDGKSAYEIAVAHGFQGTEEEWLASLKGDGSNSGVGEDVSGQQFTYTLFDSFYDSAMLNKDEYTQEIQATAQSYAERFNINEKNETAKSRTIAIGANSHAEGSETKALNQNAHAEGSKTTAKGLSSHSEGFNSRAFGIGSHAENGALALGSSSHAENFGCAYGPSSHAEGVGGVSPFNRLDAKRLIDYGRDENYEYVYPAYSPEEIYTAWYDNNRQHLNRRFIMAYGGGSHVGGNNSLALGHSSFSHGIGTIASLEGETALGILNVKQPTQTFEKYTDEMDGYLDSYALALDNNSPYRSNNVFSIGNGYISAGSRTYASNAFSVTYTGVVKAASTITASTAADYAENFEWLDGNPNNEDRVGLFVTLDGDKIKIANSADEYILGVVSGNPFVLGNGDCDVWNGMWLRDEFGRIKTEPAPKYETVEVIDEDGKTFKEYRAMFDDKGNQLYEGTQKILNPNYNQDQPYVSRMERPEWSPVGMLGVLSVYDNGMCEVNGYCTVGYGGTAIPTNNKKEGYRIIKRMSDNVVQIIFR